MQVHAELQYLFQNFIIKIYRNISSEMHSEFRFIRNLERCTTRFLNFGSLTLQMTPCRFGQ